MPTQVVNISDTEFIQMGMNYAYTSKKKVGKEGR